MDRVHLSFGGRLRRKTVRNKSGEDGKNKSLVILSRWQEKKKKKKKNDLDRSYLADKIRTLDDDLIARGKAPVKTQKFSRDPSDDLIARGKAPVKTRKFSRDPRLGAAERIRQYFRDIIKEPNTPGEMDLDPDQVSSDDSDSSPAVEPGIDFEKEMAEFTAFAHKNYPRSDEAWFGQYDEKLKELEENEEEYLAEKDYTVASEAVKFYNDKHSTNYVVVETLGSYSAEFDDGFWTHCNFRAQNTGAGPAGRRPLSRLFFAELSGDVDGYKVDSCVTLGGPGHCRDIVRGCEMCPKRIQHPVNGYKVGHPDEYTL